MVAFSRVANMSTKADLLFTGGPIYTGAAKNPAGFLAISEGKVLAVGRGSGKIWRGKKTEVIDLRGISVTPGLVDSHIHFLDFAFNLERVQLVDCRDLLHVLQLLRDRARNVQPGEWILGRGWRETQLGGFPHKKLLDEIFPENPVVLHSHDEHFRWVNTRVLQIAGITGATKIDGGFVGVDADGSPSGILGENAIALLRPHVPVPDREFRRRALLRAQHTLHRCGIVGLHSMDANKAFGDLQDLHTMDQLRLRILHSIPIRQLEEAVEIGMKSGFGDRWFRFGMVKIFSDGALGSRSALMLEPYLETNETGIEILPEPELKEKIQLALSNGIAVAVHAIGDRANRQCLNAFEANAEHLSTPVCRSRIEHAQLLHPSDIPRFAQIGLLASMQPYHAVSDQPLAERFWGKRAQHAYAWRNLLQSGTGLIFGSDAPVEDADPMQGLRAAIHRENWQDRRQTLNPMQTLIAYTLAPAYASGEANLRGTLEPGKFADLTIFSEDPIRTAFSGARVLGTVLEGEFVYRDF